MSCRFLYLIGQLRRGGSERQLYYLLQTLDRERYRPAVAVWDYHEADVFVSALRALGVPLYPLPQASSSAGKLQAFRYLVHRLRPEVVHCFTYFLNVAAWWGTRGSSTLAIGAVRCDVTRTERSAGLLLSRISTRWPRYQIFNSHVAAANIQRWRRFFVPKRLFVVPNGVDLGRFNYVPLASAREVCIVGVGSLRSVKRWDRVLAAAAALQQRGLNFLVRIVGGGPLHGSLQQQAQALGVADRVALLGDQEDIPEILANATFLIHTSDSEGSPNAVMEAMACGRAVVATDAGDIPYVVDAGKTGFVVCRGDDAMLIDRMAQLITERDLCRRMGEAGRLKTEREFGLDQLVAETLSVYRALGWKDD